jgi:ABC-type lipoprotein release transport system permease subunit
MEIVIKSVYVLVALFGGSLALVVTCMLLLGLVLTFVLLLQLLGVLRRVPFGYNLRNLLVRWPTTLLTGIAFTLVVGLFTVMLAFVNGMNRLTEASGQSQNVMVLSDGATDEAFSSLGFGDITKIDQWPTVEKDEKGEPLTSWEVYIVVNQPIPNARPGGRQRRFLQVRGLKYPDRTGRVHNIALYPGGSWFSEAGVQALHASDTGEDKSRGEQAIQAVLGEGIARELGPDQGKPSLQVGDVFPMGDRQWAVVGILQSSGSTFDSEIWAKQQIVGEKFGKASYSTVVLRTADEETSRRTAREVSANFKSPAVVAQVETEYYEKLTATNRQFSVAAWFVAAFMALGGVFGIMVTMFAAISQRQKDIGVLRILGYARWQILQSFFLESLLLALIGGGIGCLLGMSVNGATATSIISSGQGGGKSVVLKLIVDGQVLLSGLLFALAMGNIGGLLPALSAMRVRPLESVR